MGNDISRVEHHPIGLLQTFMESRLDARLPQLFFEVISDGPHMPVRVPGTNDKVIAEIDNLSHI